MGWSLTLGKFGETEVRLHWSFFLLVLWIAGLYFAQGGPAAAVGGVIFLFLLFLCVVLHEFGHILAARNFGVKTPEILLLPIGGVSRLERFPEDPRQELTIAIAGPAVSLAIGLGLLLLLGFPPFTVSSGEVGLRQIFGQLGWINLFLAGFNLLPAFPMDGGRVLRALLATRLGYARATRVAASAGQFAAAMFGLLGLVSGNIILVLIALFVFLAAGAEAGVAQMRNSTLGLTAADVMITDFVCLGSDEPVSAAAEALIRTNQHDFPVVDEMGRLRGILTRGNIVKALHHGSAIPVHEAMQKDVPVVSPHLNADQLIQFLEVGASVVVVSGRDERPKGVVTWDNMLELMMIEKARGNRAADLR